jgi:hypothetical protein
MTELADFLKENKPARFQPSVMVRQTYGIIDIMLEDVEFYCDWISGGDAMSAIRRAVDDHRIVGAILPVAQNQDVLFLNTKTD